MPIGERLGPAKPSSPVGLLAIGIIVIATLYFAREIFVPLASAILLSVALGPIAALLRRWGFGRVLSVVAAVGLGAWFLQRALRLLRTGTPAAAMGVFRASLGYLALLFAALGVDAVIHIAA